MSEAFGIRERVAVGAAAVLVGGTALIGYQAAPAHALVETTVTVDCDTPYLAVVDNNRPALDVNGDPQVDVFTFTTTEGTVSVNVQGGQEGSVSLGTSAALEDTTAQIKQTSLIYGDILGSDSTGSVALDCEDDTTTTTTTTTESSTTTEGTTTTTESSTTTTEVQPPVTTDPGQPPVVEDPPVEPPVLPVAPPAVPVQPPAPAPQGNGGFEFGHTA